MANDDTIIIGAGLAGLFCALKLAPRPVTLMTAAPLGTGASSVWAQGGIAAAIGPGDTVEKHLADTLAAGAGLVDADMAAGMIGEASARIEDLLGYGVPFDKDLAGALVLSREAAHGERRIVRVGGDRAGHAIMQALIAAVSRTPSIRVLDELTAETLLLNDGRVNGVVAQGRQGERVVFGAQAVVLCCGGAGHLYRITTNPAQSCGQGLGMAARAGAVIADPEFVQFHPTAIALAGDPAPLATEALRGEGACLVDSGGYAFMAAHHVDGDLAPRDIVARAVFAQVQAGRGAYLDCRQAVGAAFAARFPTVYAACLKGGIDPALQPIPVVPAAHYHMGGVLTDADGRTSLSGLWAAGEVACTGVHGANRLASNSLLEAVVFAARVAQDIDGRSAGVAGAQKAVPQITPPGGDLAALRKIMSEHVGVIRTEHGLKAALRALAGMERANPHSNALTAAKLMAVSAYLRTESRGAQYREDYPETSPAWAERTSLTLEQADAVLAEMMENA